MQQQWPFSLKAQPRLLSLLALATLSPLAAQAADSGVTALPTMRVDGVRIATEERRQSVAPKVVIDGEELRRSGNGSLGDALRRKTGMYFGGAPGDNKDLRLRGLDKEYTQVLLDGRRMPDSGEKREVQLDQIPMAMIDRIEILRSPTAQMDAQGIGGTLNIILKKRSTAQRKVILGAASGDQRPMDGSAQFSWGEADLRQQWLISGGRQTRSLPKLKDKVTYNAAGVAGAREQERENKRFFENFLTPHWGWQSEGGDMLNVDLLLLDSEMHRDKDKLKFKADGTGNGSEYEKELMNSRNLGISLGWERPLAEDLQLDSHFSVRDLDDQKRKSKLIYKANGALDKRETEDEDKNDREWQFGQSLTHWRGDHELLAGYDYSEKNRDRDKIRVSNGVTQAEANGQYELEEKRFDLYVTDTWRINDKHHLQPGLRWESSELASSIPGSEADGREEHFAPSLHYRWDLAEAWALRSSVARTVRRPKFDDITPMVDSKSGTISDPNKIGNPALEPEESWGYDLGLEHYLGDNAGLIGLNLFRRDIKHLMEEVTYLDSGDGEYYKQTRNTGDGKLWGAELEFSSDLAWLGIDGLSSAAGYSWLDSEVKDQATGEKRRFKQQPGYLANIGLEYRIPATVLTVGGSWNKAGDFEDEIGNSNESTSTTEVEFFDLFVNANLTDDMTLRLAAENIGQAQKDQEKRAYNADGSLKNREVTQEYSEPLYSMSLEIRW